MAMAMKGVTKAMATMNRQVSCYLFVWVLWLSFEREKHLGFSFKMIHRLLQILVLVY
jgi:hypothetical protein